MMNALWNEMDSWSRFSKIPTNVKEDDSGYTIELAVPGMERKNFHMRVHDGVLCLRIRKGHRFHWPWQHNHTYIRGEHRLQLPGSVNADGITAKVTDGILCIRLPKKENYVSRTDGENQSRHILVA
uniref:Hsp20/alpha crystallin family protein n=1 Tax=Prevotella sp. TaxID=59823 RepID=UPI00402A3986